MVKRKPLIDQTFCSVIPFFSSWSWYFSRVQWAVWFNWLRGANRAFSYNHSVKGQLLWFCCSSSCSKVFFSLFFKLDTSMRQFKFPLLFAVIDFWSRGNIFSLHEDLSLLRLVGAQSIYIKVCFRETWKKNNLTIQLWKCNLIPTDYQGWQIQSTWPLPSWI